MVRSAALRRRACRAGGLPASCVPASPVAAPPDLGPALAHSRPTPRPISAPPAVSVGGLRLASGVRPRSRPSCTAPGCASPRAARNGRALRRPPRRRPRSSSACAPIRRASRCVPPTRPSLSASPPSSPPLPTPATPPPPCTATTSSGRAGRVSATTSWAPTSGATTPQPAAAPMLQVTSSAMFSCTRRTSCSVGTGWFHGRARAQRRSRLAYAPQSTRSAVFTPAPATPLQRGPRSRVSSTACAVCTCARTARTASCLTEKSRSPFPSRGSFSARPRTRPAACAGESTGTTSTSSRGVRSW